MYMLDHSMPYYSVVVQCAKRRDTRRIIWLYPAQLEPQVSCDLACRATPHHRKSCVPHSYHACVFITTTLIYVTMIVSLLLFASVTREWPWDHAHPHIHVPDRVDRLNEAVGSATSPQTWYHWRNYARSGHWTHQDCWGLPSSWQDLNEPFLVALVHARYQQILTTQELKSSTC